MDIVNFIEKSLEHFDEEDLIYLMRDPEWIIENSLYIDKNKKFCSCMGKLINFTNRQFEAMYIMAQEPNKSHLLDEYSYDNERQIVRRIMKVFRNAGFKEKFITKIRGIEGYRINTSVIPEMFIITK